jgi:hypothetical protein
MKGKDTFKESQTDYKEEIDERFGKAKTIECQECHKKITKKQCGFRYFMCFCKKCYIKKEGQDSKEVRKILKHLVLFV